MVTDEYDDLLERSGREFPESWVPTEEDPVIVGAFDRLDDAHTAYGPAKVAVLTTKTGAERGVWLLHSVLRNEFARVRPQRGELVAIRYLGPKQSASGQRYEAYRVVVQRDAGEPDWDALESAGEGAEGEAVSW